jgi:hypothetical protein
MRHDILIVLFAALAAVTGPTALHFYNKSQTLEEDLARLQRTAPQCAPPSLLDETAARE